MQDYWYKLEDSLPGGVQDVLSHAKNWLLPIEAILFSKMFLYFVYIFSVCSGLVLIKRLRNEYGRSFQQLLLLQTVTVTVLLMPPEQLWPVRTWTGDLWWCPVILGTRTTTAVPLGLLEWKCETSLQSIVTSHPMTAWSDWDMESLEAISVLWALGLGPWAMLKDLWVVARHINATQNHMVFV